MSEKFLQFLEKTKPFINENDDKEIILAYNLIRPFYEKRNKNNIDFEKFFIELSSIFFTEIHLSTTSVLAALFFDVVKNQDVSPEEIEKSFGKSVLNLAKSLVRIPILDVKKFQEKNQTDNFIKLLLTLSDDPRVVLIFLSDRLFRMRNSSFLQETEKLQVASEVSYLFAPISHRLGLYAIKTEMEELSMQFFHTEIFHFIENKLAATKENREKYINSFIEPLKKKLIEHHFKFEIKGRTKSIPSIWNKMKTQKVDFEEVYDIFAIRIILDTFLENEKSDCWKAYSLVTEKYTPNPHRLRDWITSPKSSGYESLHTTVLGNDGKWIEVQIRTLRMDEIAEKGQAAHWKYKEKSTNKENGDNWLVKLREILEKNEESKNEEQIKAKAELYSDEIFLFTPKGDLKKCRFGATVLDFAFEIHSNIGLQCTGAVVNGKIVPLKYVLKNGDMVRILTSKSQKANYQWLDFVTTSKAKTRIKQALKAQEFKEAEIGKEIIRTKFNSLGIEFSEENIHILTRFFECESPLVLYQQFGIGKLDLLKVKKAFSVVEKEEIKPTEIFEEQIFDSSALSKGECLIIDNNLQTIEFELSKCCSPIPGDPIFGFVTISKGTKIHKTSCPNARDMISKYPYRVVKARWKKVDEKTSFTAHLIISGKDTIGLVNEISKAISHDLKLNMQSINLKSKSGGMFDGNLSVFVNDISQLNSVINRLKSIKGITTVSRTNH